MSNNSISRILKYISGAVTAVALLSTGFVSTAGAANGVPGLLPFQGRVTDASGNPINYAVEIKFRIYPAAGTCYIYEETQSAVTPNAFGIFSVMLGAGVVGAPANSLLTVFNNDPVAPLTDSCAQPFNPAANEWRRLEMVVDGTALAMQTIGSSAFAMNAQLLQGKEAADFIQRSATITQVNMTTLTNGSDASALHNHDSVYARKDGTGGFSGNISTPGNVYVTGATGSVGIGTATPGTDLHVKKDNPTIRLESNNGSGGAPRLEFFGGGGTSRGRVEAQEGANGLRFYSGATQAMNIDASGNVIFSGSTSAAGTVGIGKYTAAQEPTLLTSLSALGAAATGTMWFNSTTQRVRVWNGSAADTVSVAGSAVSTVTGGTGITNTGTASDPILTLANTAVTAATYGSATQTSTFTVDAQGRLTAASSTPIAITPDQIVSGVGKYFTYAPNGAACSDQQILKWDNTNSRWSCAADTGGIAVEVDPTVAAYAKNAPAARLSTAGSVLDLAASGATAGTYSKVTVDTYGRVTVGADIASGEVTTALGFTPLNKAGDTMSGLLVLSADPAANLGASTKQYVDSSTSTAAANYIRRDGTAAFTGNQSMGSNKITALQTPTGANDAANKSYVDSNLAGNTLDVTGLANGQSLRWNTALTKWELYTPSTGSVTGVTGTAPITIGGTASAPVVSLANTTVTAATYGSATQTSTFTVDAQGRLTAASNTAIAIAPDQIVSGVGKYFTYAPNGAACTDQQILKWDNTNSRWSCAADAGGIAVETDPTVAAYAKSAPAARLSTAGSVLDLAASGATAGTYSKVTVDTYGRVTVGANIASGDITTALGFTPQSALGFTPVDKAGDTMTGALVLNADPAAALGASTKQYVDSSTSTAAANYTRKDGTVAFTGPQSMGSNKITSLAVPTVGGDASNKTYSDGYLGGNTLDLTGLGNGQSLRWNLALTKWEVYTPGAGSVTSVTGTAPVTIGGTASAPVVSLAASGVTAGTYSKVTVDALGRVTVGADIASGDVTTALGFTPQAALGFTPVNKAGDTMTGLLVLSANPSAALGASTKQYSDGNIGGSTLDLTGLGNGQSLRWNLALTKWEVYTPSTGSVTGVAGTAPITIGGTASAPVVSLANTAVTAATYGSATQTSTFTVDAQGRLTAASNTAIAIAPDQIVSGAGKYFTYAPNNVACSDQQILKWDNTNSRWSCAVDNGVGTETDPSVAAYAKNAPAARLSTAGSVLDLAASGATAGTYSKVTVDTYGRVTVGANIASGDVTTALGFTPVNIAGDTMTGALVLNADPAAALGASTKQYVDSSTSTAAANYTRKDGTVAFTGEQSMGSNKLTTLAAPTAGGDAVNKTYADGKVGGSTLDLTGLANGQSIRWNSTLSKWEVFTPGSGTSTTVTGTAPIVVGGTLSDPIVSLATSGVTAGTYSKVTVDTLGRVTVGANIASGDVTTALGFTPVNKAGDTMSGLLVLSANPSAALGASTKQYTDGNIGGSTLDLAGLGNGQSLRWNLALTKWEVYTPSTGTVTGVTGTAPIAIGGTAAAPVVSLNNTAVTAASYGSATQTSTFTVDAQGRLTAASSTAIAIAPDQIVSGVGKYFTYAPNGTACSDQQILKWDNTNSRWSCAADAGGITVETDPTVAAYAKAAPAARLSTAGSVLDLAASGVSAGSYSKVTVDTYGRVTVGANIASGDVTTALGFTPVDKAGDTMTGALVLSADPLVNLAASTKQYVDSSTSTAAANYIRRDGTVAFTGSQSMGSNKLTSVAAPTVAGDASNKAYSDGFFGGTTLDLTGLANGQSVKWNAGGAKWDVFTPGTGTVTGVTGTAPIAIGGTAAAPVVSLNDTAVTAASYGSATQTSTFTVDAKGRLTAASNTAIAIAPDQIVSGAGKYLTYAPNNVACADGQVLKWDNTNTRWSCAADTDTGITSETDPTVAAYAKAAPAARLSTAGSILDLAASGVTANTYSNITVDTYGRITSAAAISSGNVTTALGFTPVNKAGDTLTGLLVLSADPAAALGAATKQYVDSSTSTAAANYTRKDGTVAFTGPQSMGSNKITSLAAPTVGGDASNKTYTDGNIGGSTLDLTGLGNGQSLRWNLALTKWEVYTPGTGTVTSVTGTAPIAVGGTAAAPVVSLNNTAVTPASYGSATQTSTFTVDAQGRLTAAASTAIAIAPDQIVSGAGKYFTYAPNGTACADTQVLKWDNTNTRWSCAADAGITSETDPTVAAYAKNAPAARLSTTGSVLDLAASGVTANTYSNITVDTYGRITSAAAISSGNVTTALGYTPVNKAGDSMSGLLVLSADPAVALGAATKQYADGRLGGSTLDLTGLATGQSLRWNLALTKWEVYTPATGTVTSVSAGTGISVGGTAAAPTVAIANTAVTAAAYGSATQVATFTVDAQGRLTAAASTAIAIAPDQIVSGAGKYFTYAPNNVACADTQVLKWDNTNTRWSCAADAGITSETDPTVAAYAKNAPAARLSTAGSVLDLAASGVTANTYSNITVDTYGRITSAAAISSGNVTTALGFTPLNKAGDTMTGLLVLSADPSAALGASTKQYVDSSTSTAAANYTRKDGTVPFTGNQSMGTFKITSLGTPTVSTDAATKAYADGFFGGNTLDLTGLANAQSVRWNSALSKWEVYTPSTGTVTSVTASTGISVGGTAAAPTVALATSGVTANTYSNVTVDTYGRITAAAAISSGNVTTALGFTPLNRAGDTFTGTVIGKASTLNGTTTVDFATGNIQHTAASCGAFTLNNMTDGGTYMFIVKGATSGTCSFTAWTGVATGSLTVKMPPGHTASTAARHTLYNFMVSGSDLYVSYVPGY